jgi:hypothetical protein
MSANKIVEDSQQRPQHHVRIGAIIGIIIAVLVIGFVILFTWAQCTLHKDITEGKASINAKTWQLQVVDDPGGAATNQDSSYFDPAEPLTYYKTIDEAITNSKILQTGDAKDPGADANGSSPESIIQRSPQPVLQLEDKDAVTLFYLDYYTNAAANFVSGSVNLTGYVLDKKDGRYSDVRYILRDGNLWSPSSAGLSFDEYDKVAESICFDAASAKVYARANNDTPTYLGFSDDPSVLNLRIGGKAPTRFITTQCQGKTYYVWYYQGTDFRKLLLANPSFSFLRPNGPAVTYQQVEQMLGITFKQD